MNAQEMIERAESGHSGKDKEKRRNRYYLHPSGLTWRVVYLLGRSDNKYVNGWRENRTVDIDKIRQDVLSGEILNVRNLGKGTLLEICEWLEKQENE